MASELMLQPGPGAGPEHRVGGGSFKGIKTSPTKQIQGYIIQTAELLINKFSLLPAKATYDPGFNTLYKDLFFCVLMFLWTGWFENKEFYQILFEYVKLYHLRKPQCFSLRDRVNGSNLHHTWTQESFFLSRDHDFNSCVLISVCTRHNWADWQNNLANTWCSSRYMSTVGMNSIAKLLVQYFHLLWCALLL